MNIHSVYRVFQARFRPRRIALFRKRFPLIDDPSATILDVGGTPHWWADVRPATCAITIVNVDRKLEPATAAAGFSFSVADGRDLPYADAQFDLAHSNSVIEHVGGEADQRRFAAEMLRCGRAVYVQTPNKWFPVEPHLVAPFIHWLPFEVQRRLVRWCSVWGWVNRPTQTVIDAFLRDIRLLGRAEFVSMFPGCEVWEEKVLGITKSFVLTRGGVALPVDGAATGAAPSTAQRTTTAPTCKPRAFR